MESSDGKTWTMADRHAAPPIGGPVAVGTDTFYPTNDGILRVRGGGAPEQLDLKP